MSRQLERIPLFPLNTVVFPYAQMQIHVFEDRYKQMVDWCLSYDAPFGIALIRAGEEVGGIAEPYLVGTVVRIIGVHRYDDGCCDVQVMGERRFRIRNLDESQEYLIGEIEDVTEMEVEENYHNQATLGEAREQCQMLVQHRFGQQGLPVRVIYPTDPLALSFSIANMLQMSNLEKQRLLEITDSIERVETILPMLRRQILELEDQNRPGLFRMSSDMVRDELFPN